MWDKLIRLMIYTVTVGGKMGFTVGDSVWNAGLRVVGDTDPYDWVQSAELREE